MTYPDPHLVTARLIELLGGIDQVKALLDEESNELKRRWETDTNRIGRVLRAHLYVEHYLSEHVSKANPRLNDLREARLSFPQKLALLDRKDANINAVIPGITRLNAIRNRLAHNLEVDISNDDLTVFKQAKMFWTLRVELAKPHSPSTDPLDVLDDFARHAVYCLVHEFSQFWKVYRQAEEEAHHQ